MKPHLLTKRKIIWPHKAGGAGAGLELPLGLDLYDDFSEYTIGTWGDEPTGGAGPWNGGWRDLGSPGKIQSETFDGTETKQVMNLNLTRIGRQFTWAAGDWTTIRIGFRYMLEHHGNLDPWSGTDFDVGIASGTADIYPPASSVVHALVIRQTPGGLYDDVNPDGKRRFTSAGTPYHQFQSMVGSTDTNMGAGTSYGAHVAKSDSTATANPWANMWIMEFTKDSVDGGGLGTDYSLRHVIDRSGVSGSRDHVTKARLVTAMNETTMADVETYLDTGTGTWIEIADTTIAADESTDGEFDAITFSWDQTGGNNGLYLLDVGVRFIA